MFIHCCSYSFGDLFWSLFSNAVLRALSTAIIFSGEKRAGCFIYCVLAAVWYLLFCVSSSHCSGLVHGL